MAGSETRVTPVAPGGPVIATVSAAPGAASLTGAPVTQTKAARC
jgi:hypothetical protein